MKHIKIILLFYSSIFTLALITIGFISLPYKELAPTLLLIPAWLYFSLSIVKKISSHGFFNTKRIHTLIRVLRVYSLFIILMIILASLAYSKSILESTFTIIYFPVFISCWLDIFNKKSLLQYQFKKLIVLIKLIKSMKKMVRKKGATKIDKKVAKKEAIQTLTKISNENEKEPEVLTKVPEEYTDVRDFRRRQFLKIVGGGGVSLFLMLFVFKKDASAAFFGSGGGPGVVALKDTSGTKIDPAEKQPTDGYGISQIDDSGNNSYYGFVNKSGNWYIAKETNSGDYRYVKGSSGFSTNWTNRTSLTYDYFDNIF